MKRALFLVFCWLFLACSGGDGGLKLPASGPNGPSGPTGPTGNLDAGVGSAVELPTGVENFEDVHPHMECLDTNEKFDPSMLWAKAKTLPAIGADGTTEVPLSAKGCVRLVRSVQGGQLRSLSVRRWSGFATSSIAYNMDFNNIRFFEYEHVYLNLKVAADGSLDMVFNLDDDQEIDARLTESYAGAQIARQEFTRFNSNTLVERRTLTSVNADTIHFKVERLRNGALTTISDFDTTNLQNQKMGCYAAAPGPNDTVPCSDEKKQMLRDRMKSAIERGVGCLNKFDEMGSIEQFRLYLFYAMEADSVEIECFQSDEYWGQMSVGNKGPKLRVNTQLFDCEQDNQNFIDATLFHEVLHEIRGPHDEHDNELDSSRGPFGPRANAYTDSIRACEEICFGTIKTACSCAACLQTDTCDSRCSNMGSCVSRDPMMVAQMSEAVGALCADPAKVEAKLKKSTWHATMMDCESSCAFGPGQCKSYSLSCDDSCQ